MRDGPKQGSPIGQLRKTQRTARTDNPPRTLLERRTHGRRSKMYTGICRPLFTCEPWLVCRWSEVLIQTDWFRRRLELFQFIFFVFLPFGHADNFLLKTVKYGCFKTSFFQKFYRKWIHKYLQDDLKEHVFQKIL